MRNQLIIYNEVPFWQFSISLGISARFANRRGLVRLCLSVCLLPSRVAHSSSLSTKKNNFKNCIFGFWYSPSNGVIAKLILDDHEILFEYTNFEFFLYLEWQELLRKSVGDNCWFWHFHPMVTQRNCTPRMTSIFCRILF